MYALCLIPSIKILRFRWFFDLLGKAQQLHKSLIDVRNTFLHVFARSQHVFAEPSVGLLPDIRNLFGFPRLNQTCVPRCFRVVLTVHHGEGPRQ
jgi:hypothetical protein